MRRAVSLMSRDDALGDLATSRSTTGSASPASTEFSVSSFLQGLTRSLVLGRSTGQSAAGSSNLQLSLRLSGSEGAPSASTSIRPRDPGEGSSQRPALPGRQDSRPLSQVSGAGDDASEADTTTSEATTEVAARQEDTSIPGIDIQAVTAWFEKAAPFVGLLGIIFFWQHIVGIIILVYLTSLIHKFNGVMRKEVALKEECSRWVCLALGAVAAIQVIGVLGLLYKQQLWTNLYLMPSSVDGLWSCVFKVAVVDALIRTLGFILKSLVLLLHPAQPEENSRRRSQVLAFLEQLMGMYRTVAAVPCWLLYYDSLSMGAFWTSSMHGLYLWFKARNLFTELTSAWACGKALVRREFVYGQLVHPSDPQLMEGGGTCPICQDTMNMPIKLTCSHLFCDTCISTWLARERTCPMCRTIVRPAGTMGCTDGSTSLAPLLF